MQGWEEGVETENDDKTCEGEGRRKEGRWIWQPSVKTHKIIIQCSSSSFPSGKCLFFLDVCLAASTCLAFAAKGFSFALAWATDTGEQSDRPSTGRAAQSVLRSCSHPGLLARVAPQAFKGDSEGLLAL